ncbi:MAG: hypothetical protein WAL32_10715 [Terriglobales bacterium]
MAYVHPEEALAPKSRMGGILEVIHPGGENQMSVARILWDEEERIAARWNGDDRRPLGNPVSRGRATWFVIEEYAAGAIEAAARAAAERSPNSLVAQYREMASDSEREAEAEEWSEGLIGDASAER